MVIQLGVPAFPKSFAVLGKKGLMKLIRVRQRFGCSFVFQTFTVVSTTRLTLSEQGATPRFARSFPKLYG